VTLGALAFAWYYFGKLRQPQTATLVTETPLVAISPAATPAVVAATPEPSVRVTVTEETPAALPATPTPAATSTPAKTPTPGKSPTPAKKPTPAPAASAATAAEALRAQQQATQIASLLNEAQTAYTSQRFDAAVTAYDQVLQLDPQRSEAAAGRQAAVSAAFCWKRAFVPGRTSVQSPKGSRDSNLQGFESADVKVARAPDYSGLIEFSVSPARVKPGDGYSVRVNLTNDGKKAARIAAATVTLVTNGERTTVPTTAPSGEMAPRQAATLAQLGGSWSDSTRSWMVEVSVVTTHGETFSNQLSWR
jgi:hypothetical protein